MASGKNGGVQAIPFLSVLSFPPVEQLVPILVLAAGVGILALLSWLIVRLLRPRIGRKALFAAPAPFVLAVLTVYALVRAAAPNSGPPAAVPASEAGRLTAEVASFGYPLSYSGLAFFKGKLYAATNIGLLEIEKGRLTRVFQPQKEDAVVSGPWVDRAHDILWLLDDHTFELLKFDGVNWQRIQMPTPPNGFYTRGDVLEGLRTAGNNAGFWMASAGGAWEWSPGQAIWKVIPVNHPPEKDGNECFSQVIGVLPIGTRLFVLWRHELLPYLIRHGEDYHSDGLAEAGDAQHEIPSRIPRFMAETWAVSKTAGYICTKEHELLEVSNGEISRMEAPGACETVAVAADGELIAAIRSKGIFKYKAGSGWNLLAEHPYPSGAGEYWTHIADNDSEVACAIAARLVVAHFGGGPDIKFTKNAPTTLWVAQGGAFREVNVK